VDPTKRGRNEPFTVGDHGGMEFGGRFTLYNGGDLDAMTGDLMHSALVNCSSECVAPGWGGGGAPLWSRSPRTRCGPLGSCAGAAVHARSALATAPRPQPAPPRAS
jgi:hypothetical protein